MTVVRSEFAGAYSSALDSHQLAPTESALRASYELGREAVARGLSVLDLAAIHHEALLSILARTASGAEAERAAAAAADFFAESLSAFEMVQRGFREARETAHVEQRQTLMLRQLSSFLADTSLALDGAGAVEEVLHLVAEHARELVGATWSFASISVDEGAPLVAASPAVEGVAPASLLELVASGGPDSAALAALIGADGPIGGRLAAPLSALDGRELGSIEVLGKRDGDFTDVDNAILAHLAESASAAIERGRLYEHDRRVAEGLRRAARPDRLPELDGLELAAAHGAGAGVWYGVVPRGDGSVGIALGTVTGPARSASLVAGHARTAFVACAAQAAAQPQAVLDRVERSIREFDSTLASRLLYVAVDPTRRQVSVARTPGAPLFLLKDGTRVLRVDEPIASFEPAATLVFADAAISARSLDEVLAACPADPGAICAAVLQLARSEQASVAAVVAARLQPGSATCNN